MPTDDAAAKVVEWQTNKKDFLERTGLKWQPERERIGLQKPILQNTLTDKQTGTAIPYGSEIKKIRIIVGANSPTPLRYANKLVEEYGSSVLNWQKKGGIQPDFRS